MYCRLRPFYLRRKPSPADGMEGNDENLPDADAGNFSQNYSASIIIIGRRRRRRRQQGNNNNNDNDNLYRR